VERLHDLIRQIVARSDCTWPVYTSPGRAGPELRGNRGGHLEYQANRNSRELQAELEERLRFEMLLTELSAHFVSVTADSIDSEIVDAQRRIVQELDLDRSTLAELKDGERFVVTHAWHLPGLEPFPAFAVKDLPWMSREVLDGKVVCFARIDDLPEEAASEKEAARRFGPRSNVTFPFKVGGKVIGAMAFGTVHRERQWPQALVNRLRLFVEMIGNSLARTHAERALHDSEERLRIILDSTAEGIYGIDLQGRCTFCNQACLRILGYELVDELIGKKMHDLIHERREAGKSLPLEECRICRATDEGVHVDNEALRRSNGTSFPAEYWRYPQLRGSEVVGAAVAFVDITKRKMAEAALAAVNRKLIDAQEQERSRIARELHDDIGQRLALMAMTLAQLQRSTYEAAELPSQLGILQKQTSEVAADVQSLSHELHSSRLQYLGVVAAMRGFCKEFGEQQKVEIDFRTNDLPIPLSPEVSLCFFRVLQEALNNAAKHSGMRHFEVRLWETPDDVRLTISDSGSGFDVDAAKESRGLGLVSMEERLKLLRGTLTVESKLQGGTTIHASVPIGGDQTPTLE
jgi:PAS domain S-box-containing protein